MLFPIIAIVSAFAPRVGEPIVVTLKMDGSPRRLVIR